MQQQQDKDEQPDFLKAMRLPDEVDWDTWQTIADLMDDDVNHALKWLVAKQFISDSDCEFHKMSLVNACYNAYPRFRQGKELEKQFEKSLRNFMCSVLRNFKGNYIQYCLAQKRRADLTVPLESDMEIAIESRTIDEWEVRHARKALLKLCTTKERFVLWFLVDEGHSRAQLAKVLHLSTSSIRRTIIIPLQGRVNLCFGFFTKEELDAIQARWMKM